jgi:branched-chain amino acid transport system substrate-binding protein
MDSRLRKAALIAAAAALALVPFTSAGAQQQGVIKVGIVFSYTGTASALGKLFDAAITSYQQQYGTTVAGKRIELIKRDDGGANPENVRRLMQELIVQENVDVLAGIAYTPNAVAAGELASQAKKPLLIVNAATSGIIAKSPYAVRFGFTTPQVTEPIAHWAIRNNLKTAYIIYQDYGPGVDARATFKRVFQAQGGTIVGESPVALGNTDLSFAAQIQRAREAKPQALFVWINSTSGGPQFLKSYKEAGLDKLGIKLIATGDLVDEMDLQAAGDAAIGVVSSSHYSAAHPSKLNDNFKRAFATAGAGSTHPDALDVAAYDVMAAIYKLVALQKGTIDPAKTMELLKGMKFESPRGPIMIDPVTRDIVQNVYIRRTERKNGILVNTELETIPMVKDPIEQ